MHHPTDRIAHITAFVTPVVEHWLEQEIAQWVHSMKDRSDDPSHHERTLLPRSYISLLPSCLKYEPTCTPNHCYLLSDGVQRSALSLCLHKHTSHISQVKQKTKTYRKHSEQASSRYKHDMLEGKKRDKK